MSVSGEEFGVSTALPTEDRRRSETGASSQGLVKNLGCQSSENGRVNRPRNSAEWSRGAPAAKVAPTAPKSPFNDGPPLSKGMTGVATQSEVRPVST